MKIKVTSIPVLDQEKALTFYTEKLGFTKKAAVSLAEGNRWLTVVHPTDPNGVEILLEPSPQNFAPAKTYQKALFDAGIPCAQFYVDDVDKEYKKLQGKSVRFKTKPTEIGSTKIAVFDDTCGNYIQLVEMINL